MFFFVAAKIRMKGRKSKGKIINCSMVFPKMVVKNDFIVHKMFYNMPIIRRMYGVSTAVKMPFRVSPSEA